MTTFSDAGVRGEESFSIPPSHEVFRRVPAERSATTEVEYFGGRVGAAAVVTAGRSNASAAARCVGAGRSRWFLPEVPTGGGQASYAIVMNPFVEPAEFDVVLQSDKRMVAPGALGPYVLGGRSSVALPINRFLLASPGERSVSARIVPRTGRVIAGALVSSATALSAEAGVPSLERRSVVPSAGSNDAEIVVINTGKSRADLSLVAVSRSAEHLVSGPNGLSIPPASAARAPLPPPPAAAIVEAINGQPFAAVMAVAGPQGDTGIISGSSSGHWAWLVLPSVAPRGGRSQLVLVNPGQSVASVTLSLFGPDGPVPGPAPISIRPGRRSILALPSPGGVPLSVLARARGGTIVAGSASYSAAGGYAATEGVPIRKRV
jgi:hypothetical protein